MIFNAFYFGDEFLCAENQLVKLNKCICENLLSFRI